MNKPALFALIMFVVLFVVLSGCDPYQGVYPEPTRIATPTAAVSVETATQPATDQPISTPHPSCTVTTGVPAGYLNIRSGPGMQYAVIDILSEGDVLTPTRNRADGWIEVTANHPRDGFASLTGWINGRYCQ